MEEVKNDNWQRNCWWQPGGMTRNWTVTSRRLEISQPSSTIAGAQELYQQLLSTKVYHHEKKDWIHYLMSHAEEFTPHVLAVYSAQTKYLARHNSLWVAKKTDNIPPLFSPTEPNPVDENQRAKAYWNVLVYAKNTEVRLTTIDVRKINKEDKKATLLEMSCPWMENREEKESEKTMRYAPLRRFWAQDAEVAQGW